VASGYANDPVMKNPDQYGFTASISKPFRKVELAKMLEIYLNKRDQG
jgi:two-component system, cell cycle sensor histidine kinase and response regulator CckA